MQVSIVNELTMVKLFITSAFREVKLDNTNWTIHEACLLLMGGWYVLLATFSLTTPDVFQTHLKQLEGWTLFVDVLNELHFRSTIGFCICIIYW